MNTQKGKTTFMSMIAFCILALASVMVFKYFANSIDKKQIKKEIFDEIGVFRGRQLTETKIEEIVAEVLSKRSLQPLEVFSEFKSSGRIHFSYKYEINVNYLLFKHSEIVAVEDEMDNFGG